MAGLGAGLAIRGVGHEVTILEQAPAFGEIGAGVQVPPNAARELIRWGLCDKMAAIASTPDRINYRSWKTGKATGFSRLSNHEQRYGAPYWQVFRPDYHTILLEAAIAAGVKLRPGCVVSSYDPPNGAVVLESGEMVKGDLIVAADGVKSIARHAVGQEVEPHETGDTCFRAVIPGEMLLADPDLASLVSTPSFEQWLGPDHHIIGYNMQKDKNFNLLMVIPDDEKMKGYKAPATGEEVRQAFAGWSQMTRKLLAMIPEDVERWRLIDLPPVQNWVHPSNRMVVIGDAAHATLPYLAQGAAMAIEDASALGFALSKISKRNKVDLPAALAFFCALRRERAHTVQRGSWTNRFFIHMRDGPQYEMREDVFQAGDYPGSPNLMGNSLFQDWLYGYDVLQDAEKQWQRAHGTVLAKL
ncbi:hypothetical protein BAUCODRAFT_149158 [Baudoinia panamericana UAMH 10762]|uniref:FAD-binding domain-containing protein n=1 Tax=Baudoinia panamericana (strain UAMH 10762) TaxID=717646 RepID=M2N8H9_BAUPA|nr:uncharacterized protein BAUCODRAFT_149158 [Baudoinia panamericana UAMH 10762]EMC95135.1 hypothetical protein BAUCODRAFT_149158 [Baudoinia panamericana UAMH 10762]